MEISSFEDVSYRISAPSAENSSESIILSNDLDTLNYPSKTDQGSKQIPLQQIESNENFIRTIFLLAAVG